MTEQVLVTGAAGFMGSHLCEALLRAGYAVVGLDDLSMGKLENLAPCAGDPRFRFERADVTDAEAVSRLAAEARVIVHLAAFKIPRYGKAVDTLRINSLGMTNVLNVAARTGAKVVAASTSDVYGKNPELPFTEESDCVLGPSTVPRWSYAVSKLFDEHLAFAYQEAYGFPVVLARFFGSYGPRQHLSWWGGPQAVFIDAVLLGGEIEIHGDGLQTRSFCYVDDTVDGILRLVERVEANGHVFNLGATHEVTILELARRIQELAGVGGEPRLRFVPYATFGKYEDVRRRVPDVGKARRMLGFEPKVSLEEGLERTIAWQRRARGL